MSYFDLNKTLHWEPVRLNDGRKAYIFVDLRAFSPSNIEFPLFGGYFEFVEDENGVKRELFYEMRWDLNGFPINGDHLDIILGMFE